jgi:hypothetical protein
MKISMQFAACAALAGVLAGANLIAQTSAKIPATSAIVEPMEIPIWPGVAGSPNGASDSVGEANAVRALSVRYRERREATRAATN